MKKIKTTFFKDFKAFISKGNIVDMAVGVVIGGSFGKIVTGLVNYIINPCMAAFLPSGNLDSIKTVVTPEVLDETGAVVAKEVAILWGTWAQTVIDFLITALCIFIVLRMIMMAKNTIEAKKIAETKAKEAEEKAKNDAAAEALKARQLQLEEAQINQEKLLEEIRDLLKNK